jgi:hypothetical protein
MVDHSSLKHPPAGICDIQEEIYNPIEEILLIFLKSETKSVDSIDFCMDFFNNWNQICIDREDANLKTQLEKSLPSIKNLLSSNLYWIKDFLKSFTFVFLKDSYTHIEICELRSGIEHFLDLCADLKIDNENLKEFVKNELKYIDSALDFWLNDHVEIENNNHEKFQKSYPKTHHWWNHLSIKENLPF